jgi:hypothetical protein
VFAHILSVTYTQFVKYVLETQIFCTEVVEKNETELMPSTEPLEAITQQMPELLGYTRTVELGYSIMKGLNILCRYK